MSVTFEVTVDRFPELARALRRNAQDLVTTTTANIVRRAQSRAPVLSGAFRASIYAATSQQSGYSAAVSAVQSHNPHAQLALAVAQPLEGSGVVASAVAYAPYIEYGTRMMAARPVLGQAVVDEQAAFQAGVARLLEF